jgi:hypothetical protein
VPVSFCFISNTSALCRAEFIVVPVDRLRQKIYDDAMMTDAKSDDDSVLTPIIYDDGEPALGPIVPVEPWVQPVRVVLKRLPARAEVEFTFSAASKLVRPGPQVLRDFCGLASDVREQPGFLVSDPQRLQAFAHRYGPLGLCRAHSFPSTHSGPSLCPLDIDRKKAVSVVRESWDAWNRFSRLAAAIIGLLVRRADTQVGDVEALKTITRGAATNPRDAVLSWLGLCRINFWLDPEMRLGFYAVPSLFGYLGIQLALVAGRRRGLAICASCGDLFEPNRMPAVGRRSYCKRTAMCRTARWRDAQRDHRSDLRKERKE